MVVLLASAMNAALGTVRRASGKIDQISSARAGFDLLMATLSQATLNTYWDYATNAGNLEYKRASDLHFIIEPGSISGQSVFFQSPLGRSTSQGAEGLLNAVGYWVEFGDDSAWRPAHVETKRFRYRLMQGVQPAEALTVFKQTNDAWKDAVQEVPEHALPIAENVVALILWPRLPTAQDSSGTLLGSDYLYDSRDGLSVQSAQLPPMLQATIIVIDEASAIRLESGASEPTLIKNTLNGKFQNVAQFDTDLSEVKAAFDAERINYQILSVPVTLRESKWSKTP